MPNHDASRPTLDVYPAIRRLSILYGDMDVNRHVNNVAIARYFEEGRSSLVHSFRAGIAPARAAFVTMLVQLTIDYLAEVRYPGDVVVGSGLLRLGRSSFVLASALFQDNHCVAISQATAVNVERGSRSSAPLLPEERAGMERYLIRLPAAEGDVIA